MCFNWIDLEQCAYTQMNENKIVHKLLSFEIMTNTNEPMLNLFDRVSIYVVTTPSSLCDYVCVCLCGRTRRMSFSG